MKTLLFTTKTLFLSALLLFSTNSQAQEVEVINENMQDWPHYMVISDWSQTIDVGNRTDEMILTECMSFPEGEASGTGTEGFLRITNMAGAAVEFPEVPSAVKIKLSLSAFDDGQTIEMQKLVDGNWEFEQTFAGIGETANTWTYDEINADTPTILRLTNPSAHIKIHDIIIITEAVDLPFDEDFSGYEVTQIPVGWQRDIENFGVQNTSHAGGEAPEMALSSSPAVEGKFYLTTPYINTAGLTAMEFSFKSLLNHDDGDCTIKVVALADGNEYAIESWVNPGENIGPDEYEFLLTENHGVGSEMFQLAFVYEGDTDNINWWFFDDVLLEETVFEGLPYNEDFTGVAEGEIPEGWNRDIENFGVSLTNDAGGEEPEMQLYHDPEHNGLFYLTTPYINTAGYDELEFSFRNYLNEYPHGDTYSFRVVTLADGDEHNIEEWVKPGDIEAHVFETILNAESHGVGAEDFRIAFVFDGNTDNINWWRFDDIHLAKYEQYSLILAANPPEGGNVGGAGEYDEGQEVPIKAVANEGWEFDKWTFDIAYVDNPMEAETFVTMPDKDVTVVALFEETYTLSLEADPEDGGIVEGSGEYREGVEVDIKAIALEGYEFVEWTGDVAHIGDPEDATTTVLMPDEDISLIALFEEKDDTFVENTTTAEIKLFPNPANKNFTVESNEIIKQITILDVSGQIVKDVAANDLRLEINTNNLKAGIYFLQINTTQKVITKRVQIIK